MAASDPSDRGVASSFSASGSALRGGNLQKRQLLVTLNKINLDTSSEEPNFLQKKLQVRLFGGKQLVLVGKTETKSINSKKPTVSLTFTTAIEMPAAGIYPELRVVLLVDGKQYGTAAVATKDFDESGGKALRKKFRNAEGKVIASPYVSIEVQIVALASAPKILLSELTFGSIIGEGSFGVVHAGKCRGFDVAIKKLISITPRDLEDFMNEMNLMRETLHPNLLLLMGVCVDEASGAIYAVSELMSGDLYRLLVNEDTKQIFPPDQIIGMAIHAANALLWLHARTPSILHRDIKPSNILHDKEFRVKVADLGLSKEVQKHQRDEQLEKSVGTPLYMSPELLNCQPATTKSDVYAFAITLWEMVSQSKVWPEFQTGTAGAIKVWLDQVINRAMRPPLDPSWPKSFQDLLTEMWDPVPAKRPEFSDIVTRLAQIQADFSSRELEKMMGPVGAAFWLESFASEKSVTFSRFIHKFYPALRLPVPADRYLMDLPGLTTAPRGTLPPILAHASPDQLDNFLFSHPELTEDQIRLALRSSTSIPVATQSFRGSEYLFSSPEYKTTEERVLACLSLYLCGEERVNRIVSQAKFGDLIARFGPMEKHSRRLLERFESLVQKPYFFGFHANATRLLQPGQFLVRTSHANPCGFTLEHDLADRSLSSSSAGTKTNSVFSVRIFRTPTGEYTMPAFPDTFSDMNDLLLLFFRKFHPNPREYMRTQYCQKSPYTSIWESIGLTAGGYADHFST